jgi:hypothetical protein
MVSPIDPSTWWPWSSREPSEQGWLDAWLDLTTWWVEPALNIANRARRPDARALLVQIVEGLSRRFESQRFDAIVRTTPVSGVLESIRLLRTRGVEARLDLRDMRIADLVLERVSASVPSVVLQVAREVRLSASSPTVQLRISLTELLRWLKPRLPDEWSARLDDRGEVWAKHTSRDVEVQVEPALHGDDIELEVRAVRIRGRVVHVPRWFRPARTITPPLPEGVHLLGAFISGDHVDATLKLRPLDERVDLAQLREAVARRQALAIG